MIHFAVAIPFLGNSCQSPQRVRALVGELSRRGYRYVWVAFRCVCPRTYASCGPRRETSLATLALAVTIVRMMTVTDQPLTTDDAARILGVTAERVRQLCTMGYIGTKVGVQWLFSREELLRFREVHKRTPGPEKKSENRA